jgi:release factor glutamine methyltransferase
MTIEQTLRRATDTLRAAGIDNPRFEARLLLAHILGCTPSDLLRDAANMRDAAGFEPLLARRAAHEPMAYILGHQPFWSLDFQVSPATLIPRADSEALVEAALTLPHPAQVLDLGTGTGCLLLSVLHERPAAFGIGVDLNPAAAALARHNAEALGLTSRAAFLCGDWATACIGAFELVLSNPPYIDTPAIASLMPEVAEHEPVTALDGGPDGLAAYRIIISSLPGLLAPNGSAVLELGIGQAEPVAALGRAEGFSVTLRDDLSGIPRAIILRMA